MGAVLGSDVVGRTTADGAGETRGVGAAVWVGEVGWTVDAAGVAGAIEAGREVGAGVAAVNVHAPRTTTSEASRTTTMRITLSLATRVTAR